MSGFPWFKIYAAETLSDEHFQGWTVDERGAWFTLILIAWREGSIPGDQTSLAKLLHVDGPAMRSLWSAIGSRFVEHPDYPGRLTSPRLEKEREKAEQLAEKRGEAGKRGATSRWDKEKSKHGKRIRLLSQADAVVLAKHSEAESEQSRADSEAAQTAGTASEPEVWEVFRDLLADRMVVPRDWLKVASADRVAEVRGQVNAEVERLGLARALEVAAESASKAKSKPRWLSYFVGALQDARRNASTQDDWQDAPRSTEWRDEQGRTLREIQAAEQLAVGGKA
jgi:uncharacterized protein YdaU (DUF1376 family)